MTDMFTPAQRSRIMRAVKGSGTTPEMTVRRLVHGMGYRFRLCRRDLPGSPDLVLPRLNKVIFVHGCFWHRHTCRSGKSMPATRVDYWEAKFARNVARDRRNARMLRSDAWGVLVVWECQTRSARLPSLRRRLTRFLEA